MQAEDGAEERRCMLAADGVRDWGQECLRVSLYMGERFRASSGLFSGLAGLY